MSVEPFLRTKINVTPCQMCFYYKELSCWDGEIICSIVCVVNLVN